jgi:hypothetical protein
MREKPRSLTVLGIAIATAATAVAVVAPGASARGAEPEAPVIGQTPGPPRLSDATARQAAFVRARQFRKRSARIDSISLQRCERDGFRRVTCTFLARGARRASRAANGGSGAAKPVGAATASHATCRLTVNVRGTDAHHFAALRVSCHANAGHHLGFHKASAAIRTSAEHFARHPVVIVVARRLTALQIAAAVEWWNGATDCEARFVATLVSGRISVTHGPPEC